MRLLGRSTRGHVRPALLLYAVRAVGSLAVAALLGTPIHAQVATTRRDAIASALARNPLVAMASADRAAADAAVGLARQWENPTLGANLTKSGPQQHYSLDIPFDPWWQRSPRIAAATTAQSAAALRYHFATSSIAFDTDTAYTRAQLALVHRQLSARTARDADSLLVLARLRRDAGDASDLDVELAGVFAGQARNAASGDSVAARFAMLTLQTVMGLSGDSLGVAPADSLSLAETAPADLRAGSVLLDAANLDVRAANLRVNAERQRRFGAPAFSIGIEAVDPGGQRGALAMAGISLPLPLFNRNQANVAAARAELARAEAQFNFTRITTSASITAARRDAEAAKARAARSAQLVASANRIAAMSLLAYREGASTLLVVLESQRTARETLGQYFDDVALARNAASLLTLLLTPAPDARP